MAKKLKIFKFKKGDKVIIEDPGCNYPDARKVAIKMRATNWIPGGHDGHYCRGDRATVLNRITFSDGATRFYLIEVNKEQHIIGERGLEHLLKGILKYEK